MRQNNSETEVTSLLNARSVVDGRPLALTWKETLEQTQSSQEHNTLVAFSKRNEKLVSTLGVCVRIFSNRSSSCRVVGPKFPTSYVNSKPNPRLHIASFPLLQYKATTESFGIDPKYGCRSVTFDKDPIKRLVAAMAEGFQLAEQKGKTKGKGMGDWGGGGGGG